MTEGQRASARIFRAREGRVLGGVCAGLPDAWGLGTNGRRLLFVLATLLGGIGLVAYIACWLVIPAADHDPDADPVRSVVLLAWASGALVALVLLAVLAAAATVFGLGWIVFALAAVVLGLRFSPLRKRIPSVAALLVLGALTIPAVAVALSPMRFSFQSGQSVARPRTYRSLSKSTYHSGFGTLMIDLRRTSFPASGTATLRIDAGLRRTIIALPSDECVRVRVNYDVHLFPAHLAALLTGRSETPFHDVMMFGRPYGAGTPNGTRGTAVMLNGASHDGPLLTIDFTSQGGGLYVRDYPDNIDPETTPQWPGFPVTLEPRPRLSIEPRRLWKHLLAAWRNRLVYERASQQQVNAALPGPCGGTYPNYSAPASSGSTALGGGMTTAGSRSGGGM